MKEKTEVQRWLESVRLLEESIRCDLDDLAAFRATAEKRTTMLTLTGGVYATGERTMEDSVINMVMLEEKIARKTARLEAMENVMLQAFGRLADPQQRKMMTLRYYYGKSYLRIAEEMNIGKTKVYNLHRAALEELEKLWENDCRERNREREDLF